MIKELLQFIKQIFTWFVLVDPWELGVRTRMGRHQTNIGPGIHLRIPFFDRAYVQSVRRRMTCVPAMTLTTTDGKVITIGSHLSFEIQDVSKLYNTLHDATDTIDAIAASVVAEIMSTRGHTRRSDRRSSRSMPTQTSIFSGSGWPRVNTGSPALSPRNRIGLLQAM